MQQLIKSTAAYKIFSGDCEGGRLSHAYMLYYADEFNLREALKLFAVQFFGAKKASREERLIFSEGLPDLKIYPAPEKKLTAEVAAAIVEDAYKRPLEYDRKLYIISQFESASPIFQNKLLKILEEPPQGVYFLLGATALAPVLITVRSRVKTLELPPFTKEQVFSALERMSANPLNAEVAASCGGVLGVAENMLSGGWFAQVHAAAEEICSASTVGAATRVSQKYGDFKLKKELIAEMQRIYFSKVEECAREEDFVGKLPKGAYIYAVQSLNSAFADLRFNANFSSLLYDFTLRVVTYGQGQSKR